MPDYFSPYSGQQVDSTVSAYISGAIANSITAAENSAVSTASSYTTLAVSGGVTSANSYTDSKFAVAISSAGVLAGDALSSANTYADQRTTLSTVNTAETAVDIPVLSGGYLYNYTNPVSMVTVSSCVSNSIGDVVHFTAVSAAITVNLPAGLSVLIQDDISSGSSYDIMVCDNRLIIKEIQEVTQ